MTSSSKGRILIVDDEVANMRALSDTLRDKGYETDGAVSGADALGLMRERSFDLLLTDLMMPGMDGIALLGEALKMDPHLVGILMTGQGTVETAVSAMQAGALDYVLKPIRLNVLLPVIARALDVRRLRLENLELRDTVAIHELNQAIAHTLDASELLGRIADAALGQFDADEMSIMLASDDGEWLEVVASRGVGRDHLLGVRVPVGQGVAGGVALRREPLVIEGEVSEANLAPRFPRSDIRSALSMPMIARGSLIGVINVNSVRRSGVFSPGRVKMLSLFANAAAAGIDAAQTHERQLASESRYRQLVDGVKDYAILMLDAQGRVATWNDGARALKGYDEAEIIGQPISCFYEKDAVAAGKPAQILQRAQHTGSAKDEGWRLRKNGSRFYAAVVVTVIRDAAGVVTGYSKITRDVTERMVARQKIDEQREFLRQVIDLVPNFIYAKDREGRFTLANKAVAELYGTTVDHMVGKSDSDFNPNREEVEAFRRDDLEVMDHVTEKFVSEEMITDASGRRRWLQTIKRAMHGSQGRSKQILGVSVDITALKENEGRIREQMHRAEALLEATPDPVVIVDGDGRIRIVNAQTEQVFGYSRDELLGQHVEMLIPQESHGRHVMHRDAYQRQPSRREMGADRELLARRKDGSTFHVDISLSPMTTKGGDLTIGTVRDVSERKRAEREIRELNSSLERRVAERTRLYEDASRAKDSFLATMSHEIRTPLGGLLGMLELLSLTSLNDEQTETLEAARNSGGSLLRILNDVLDWSKIEDGKLELAPQPTSLGRLMADVANTYAHVASGNSVTIAYHVDERLSPAFMVDALRLSQVLNNFVSNAIKFSHRGGRVTLTANWIDSHDGAAEVRFSVADTGIGIDPAVQARLFENYGQASADTARMYGGTGLGLAICRRLAHLMGGRIDLDSAPGRGSTFSLTLSLMPAKGQEQRQPTAASVVSDMPVSLALADRGAGIDAPLILVADDHEINRKLLVRQLGLLGLRSEAVQDGDRALELWRGGRYDLLITDCHMPRMDGYELANTIRDIEAAEGRVRTPIFAWTANALADERDRCMSAGMDALLVKPADIAQLRRLLASWLPVITESASARITTPAANPDAPRALDVRVLEALVGDEPEVIQEFLRDFRASAIALGADIRAACLADDGSQASAQAHRLKSSARTVGALVLGELCADVEASGATADDNALAVLLPRFEQELAAVLGCLDGLLQPTTKE